jgi:hypothetical protein
MLVDFLELAKRALIAARTSTSAIGQSEEERERERERELARNR